jgi:hypothetical protein
MRIEYAASFGDVQGKGMGIQGKNKKGAPAGAPLSERFRSSQINANLSYRTLEIRLRRPRSHVASWYKI